MQLDEASNRKKDSWEQIGVQGESCSRWICPVVQSKTSGRRFYIKVCDAETFCPVLVLRQKSLCLLMALSVQHGLTLHQVDAITAFPNGMLEEVAI